MPKVLDRMPRPMNKRGRPAVYPWAEWLDGTAREFEPSEVGGNVRSFRGAAASAGRRYGVRVSVALTEAGTVCVQALR